MTDAFDRLKNRSRATVPLRDASIVKEINDEKTEFSHSVSNEVRTGEIASEIQEDLDLFEVTRRTIRLEQTVDSNLEVLCNREKITRETFLEAAYLICAEKPELMQEMLDLAKQRYRQRKTAGERRKFQTMEKKFAQ